MGTGWQAALGLLSTAYIPSHLIEGNAWLVSMTLSCAPTFLAHAHRLRGFQERELVVIQTHVLELPDEVINPTPNDWLFQVGCEVQWNNSDGGCALKAASSQFGVLQRPQKTEQR